jgi:hypothetical protein
MLLVGTFFVVTPVMVSADQDGDYTYTVSNGEATITDYTCAGGAITIPSTLGGYPTVAIGDNAFYPCTFLTSVTIPNSVTIIGNKAFKSCTSLTTVTIGNNVTTIGDSTFYYCSSLASVTIPNNVTTIGDNAFSFCSFLNNVTIGNSVTTIGDNAFSPCSALTSVTIPNNVTTIGDNAFSSCASLNNVTIGNHVKTIGKYAFASCSSLTSITFLGLDEPTSVGTDWIKDTPAEIRGHAYAASNFPVPGGMLDFHGLKMGTVISVENIPPRANFTWTPLNPTLNQTVTFDATASNDPDGSLTVYEWDWNNDGVYDVSYTIPTAAYSWTQAGDYPVTLRVTDNGDATSTKTITIPISSGSENNNTNNKGTPGFELVFVLCAIAVSILLWKKKRNV